MRDLLLCTFYEFEFVDAERVNRRIDGSLSHKMCDWAVQSARREPWEFYVLFLLTTKTEFWLKMTMAISFQNWDKSLFAVIEPSSPVSMWRISQNLHMPQRCPCALDRSTVFCSFWHRFFEMDLSSCGKCFKCFISTKQLGIKKIWQW